MNVFLPAEFSAVFSAGTGTIQPGAIQSGVIQPGVIQSGTLAPPPKPDPGGQGEDFGKAAPTALVLLLLLFLAAALLVRSMTKHLRRIPESFDDQPATRRREE